MRAVYYNLCRLGASLVVTLVISGLLLLQTSYRLGEHGDGDVVTERIVVFPGQIVKMYANTYYTAIIEPDMVMPTTISFMF